MSGPADQQEHGFFVTEYLRMTNFNKTQLDDFRKRLDDRHRELRDEIREELLNSEEEQYIDLAGRVHDAGEESVADLLADLNIAIIDRQVNEIRQIEAARMRIAGGTYGICIDCGNPIAIERLQTMPSAPRCTRCQSHHEANYAHTGTPTL
jgi:DnaK suppressor protein